MKREQNKGKFQVSPGVSDLATLVDILKADKCRCFFAFSLASGAEQPARGPKVGRYHRAGSAPTVPLP